MREDLDRQPEVPHGEAGEPSPWVLRFAPMIPAGGQVLDLACGGGRHARYLLRQGFAVTALDRDTGGVEDLIDNAEVIQADLEGSAPYPLAGRQFAGVIVTNYLYRPLLPILVASIAQGGLMIYETFALGNERFGKPANPAFLLRHGELLAAVQGRLRVLAYEDLTIEAPRPAAVQRIAALKSGPTEP
jgi:SAM-dependent methyltransferase